MKNALKRLFPDEWMEGTPDDVHFLVQELLPQLRSFDKQYGCDELIHILLSYYDGFLRNPQHSVAVVLADDSKYVPRRKADVQASRLESWTKGKSTSADGSANKPYPEGSTLVPEGVAVPVAATDGEKQNDTTTTQTTVVEKLTVSRLCFSRSLRLQFFNKLVDTAMKFNFPSHSFVVMDVGLPRGPVLIHGDKTCPIPSTRIGEGEMLAVYWTRYLLDSFPKAHVMLKTVDTDVLPIAFHMYTEGQLPSFNVSWVHQPKQFVNLKQLFEAMTKPYVPKEDSDAADLKGCVWHSANFLGSCALSGSDYTKKADMTPGVGADFIFDAAFAMHKVECKDPEAYFCDLVRAVFDRKGKICKTLGNTKSDSYRFGLDEYLWVVKFWRTLGLGGVYAQSSLRHQARKTSKQSAAAVPAAKTDLDEEAEMFMVKKPRKA